MIIMKCSLRSFSAILLATATLCLALPSQNLLAQCDTAGTIFGGGMGTELDPYQICSIDQLNRIRDNSGGENYLDDHFVLTKDLDFEDTDGSGADYVYSAIATENTKGWLPIGHDTRIDVTFEGTKFTGSFDGGNHIIRNLYISRSNENYIGLFGLVGIGGSAKGLGLEGVDIEGLSRVGGLMGSYLGASIASCYSTGAVTSVDTVGGLVGSSGGAITSCYSTATVTGNTYFAGGLVGVNNNGTLTSCYSTGTVTGGNFVGGLAGATSALYRPHFLLLNRDGDIKRLPRGRAGGERHRRNGVHEFLGHADLRQDDQQRRHRQDDGTDENARSVRLWG